MTPAQVGTFLGTMGDFSLPEYIVEEMLEKFSAKLAGFERWLVYKLSCEERITLVSRPLRVGGRGHFLHVVASPTCTLYMPHPARGHEAMETMGFLPAFHGLAIHGPDSACLDFACGHRFAPRTVMDCLRKANEPWCTALASLLEEALGDWRQGRLDEEGLALVKGRFRDILGKAAPLSTRVNKFATLSAKDLHEILLGHEDALFGWAGESPEREGEADSWIAQDAVRDFPQGYRSLNSLRALCRLYSLIETARKHGAERLESDMREVLGGTSDDPSQENMLKALHLTHDIMLIGQLCKGLLPAFIDPDSVPDSFRTMDLPNDSL